MKKRLLFIINPISGGKRKNAIPQLIKEHLDSEKFDYEVWFWEEVDAIEERINSAKTEGFNGIVAIGGDGTINLVSRYLVNTDLFVGFVPMGSGNGLARQLGIPQDVIEAIAHLNQSDVRTIDTAKLNGETFVNVAGIGFDARVSQAFSQSKKRGLLNYSRAVINEYREAHDEEYEITVDGEKRTVSAFMLSVANGSQWGNDFFVAPDASLDDGLLDLVIMSKPSMLKIPKLVVDLNKQSVPDNQLVEIIKGKKMLIECKNEIAHVDGEPIAKSEEFTVEINPLSLNVFC